MIFTRKNLDKMCVLYSVHGESYIWQMVIHKIVSIIKLCFLHRSIGSFLRNRDATFLRPILLTWRLLQKRQAYAIKIPIHGL